MFQSEKTSLSELIESTDLSALPAMPYIEDPEETTVSYVEKNPHALLSILAAGAQKVRFPISLKIVDWYYAKK